MESQPQNPEFRINPENFHTMVLWIAVYCCYLNSNFKNTNCKRPVETLIRCSIVWSLICTVNHCPRERTLGFNV